MAKDIRAMAKQNVKASSKDYEYEQTKKALKKADKDRRNRGKTKRTAWEGE